MSAEDRQKIEELTHLYALNIDLFEVDEWANVFSPNAFFDEREFGNGLYEGREAIRAYGQLLSKTVRHVVHLMSNLVIRNLTPTTATGIVFCLCEAEMKTGERERNHVRYEDEYVKIDGEWKIDRRILRKTLAAEKVVVA